MIDNKRLEELFSEVFFKDSPKVTLITGVGGFIEFDFSMKWQITEDKEELARGLHKQLYYKNQELNSTANKLKRWKLLFNIKKNPTEEKIKLMCKEIKL